MLPETPDCKIPINTKLPLYEPYRTGSYLIYDYPPGQATHFREGTSIDLRASGSRQLDFQPFYDVLQSVAAEVKPRGRLYIFDLRQESHAFFDNRAVSWYADMDWSNVGQSEAWILRDEASKIEGISVPGMGNAQIFCLDQTSKSAQHLMPTGYSEITVGDALSEKKIVETKMKLPCRAIYFRITVTDHCAPNAAAQEKSKALFRHLYQQQDDQTWVHFHCHGGDGRTTTFLAMYDMVCWAKAKKTPFPSVKDFADRQLKLFTYNLDPGACVESTDWKCGLARARWQWLADWREWILSGGLTRQDLGDLEEIEKIA